MKKVIFHALLIFILFLIGCADKKNPFSSSNNPYTFVTSKSTTGWCLNLNINENSNRIYLANDEVGFDAYDITNSEEPVFLNNLRDESDANEIVRIKDVYVPEGDSFLIAATTYFGGRINIYNISNIDTITIDDQALTHSYIDRLEGGHEDKNKFFSSGSISLKYIYFDTSTPPYLQLITLCVLPLRNNGVFYLDGYLYIAASQQGLVIAEVNDSLGNYYNPNHLNMISSIDVSDVAQSVYVEDDIAYIAAGYGGLEIVDVSNKLEPEWISTIDFYGKAEKLVKVNDNILVTAESNGVHIIDVSSPSNPNYVGNIDVSYAKDIEYSDGYIYIADRNDGLVVYKE